MSSLFIVIPAYNEAENIERTVSEWYPIVESHNKEGQSRLVIINDGSKDNTYELICKLAQARPLLIPLTKPNGGHGSTCLLYTSHISKVTESDICKNFSVCFICDLEVF